MQILKVVQGTSVFGRVGVYDFTCVPQISLELLTILFSEHAVLYPYPLKITS